MRSQGKVLMAAVAVLLALGSCSKLVPGEEQPRSGRHLAAPDATQSFRLRIAPVDNSSWMDPARILQVRDEIDRMSDGGMNAVIVGSYYFMPMFFVDYSSSPYPEAAQVKKDKIVSNTQTLLSNIDYAHSRGIKVLSGSYSHYCPYNFWTANRSVLDPDGVFTDEWHLSVHQEDIFQNALKGSETGVVPHQQWSNSVYKDFWVWSTKAMLDVLPTLDGFLNCYAESAWTYDTAKIKAGNKESECRDMDRTNADFVDYMSTLYSILLEKKGSEDAFEIGIRDWYMDMNLLDRTVIPASKIIVSVKYGGYDQPVVACPQWGLDLKAKGYNVIFDMLVYDAEFPHPIYWYDAGIIRDIFDNLRANGIEGFAYQDYRAKSKYDEGNPIRLLTQATVAAAIQGRSFTRDNALEYLQGIYGAAADPLLRSLEAVAAAQSDIIKLTPAWFWRGDGLTVGGLGYNRPWKFGDNDPDQGGRMESIRKDVVGLPEYAEAAIKDVTTPGWLKQCESRWKQEGRRTPFEAVEDMERNAETALEAALEAREMKGHGDKFGELFASAVVHKQLVLRDVACVKGTLYFLLSGGQIDGTARTATSSKSKMIDTGLHREASSRDWFTEHVRRDLLLRELCARFTPRRPSLDDPQGYTYVSKPISAMGLSFTMPTLDTEELQRWIDLIKE